MSMDFEWYSGPPGRFLSQLGHLINRVHCRCLSHQHDDRGANIACPTRATDRSRLEVETAQVE